MYEPENWYFAYTWLLTSTANTYTSIYLIEAVTNTPIRKLYFKIALMT